MTLPAHTSVVPTEPSFAETNEPMSGRQPRQVRGRCRRQLAARLSGACACYGRQDPGCRGLQAACTDSRRRSLQCQQSAGSDSPQRRQGDGGRSEGQTRGSGRAGEQPVPKAEEQAAAAETNENLATPVPQHVPLASIKSASRRRTRMARLNTRSHATRTRTRAKRQ